MAIQSIDNSCYSAWFTSLLAEERLMELGPGDPVNAIYPVLSKLDLTDAFTPCEVKDHESAMACIAGIWLYFDYLDESHTISQQLSSPSGSYWHSIMHRREPDSGNSKYWLDRTGDHPIFPQLCTFARSKVADRDLPATAKFLTEEQWNPYKFVDLCEASRKGDVELELLCRQIQLQEWRLLFDFCYQRAVGKVFTS